MKFIAASLIVLLFSAQAKALPVSASKELISAVAKKTDGEVAYTERHEIRLKEDGALATARTDYYAPDKTLRAVLETDFKNGVAASDYTFIDNRDGSSHGVEIKDNGFLVWKKSKDGKREERLFEKQDFNPKDLVVAGQGLFFYLRNHLKSFSKGDSIPVKLLIPGRLDYFTLELSVEKEEERFISFRMKANSLLLRLFFPSLRFRFDKASNEIVEYTGPSNLVEEGGGLQTVKISYQPSGRKGS